MTKRSHDPYNFFWLGLCLQGFGGPDFGWNELQLRLWNPLNGTVASVKDAAAEMREVCSWGWGGGRLRYACL